MLFLFNKNSKTNTKQELVKEQFKKFWEAKVFNPWQMILLENNLKKIITQLFLLTSKEKIEPMEKEKQDLY